MADTGSTDMVGDSAGAGHDFDDDGHSGDLDDVELTGGEDRGDIVTLPPPTTTTTGYPSQTPPTSTTATRFSAGSKTTATRLTAS